MKYFYSFLIIIISFINASSQCYDAPLFDFEGTQVLWSYHVIDTSKEDNCIEIIKSEQFLAINRAPILIKDAIITGYDSHNYGTLIQSQNKNTGEINWINYYNRKFDPQYRGTAYYYTEYATDSTISTINFKSLSTFDAGTAFAGFINRRILNLADGTTRDFIIDDGAITKRITDMRSSEFVSVKGTEHYMYYSGFSPFDDKKYSYIMIPRFIDRNTMAKVPNTYENDTIYFEHLDSDFFSPSSGYKIEGPFVENDTTFVYTAQYFFEGKWRTEMWKINDRGSLIWRKDITQLFSVVGQPKGAWSLYPSDVESDRIRIDVRQLLNGSVYNGHAGYMEIDFDGNLIKDQRPITLDGQKVGHIQSLRIKQSRDLLHCIRFDKNKNTYFYRETTEGIFTKVGELINTKNDDIYAFLPYFMLQDEKGDLYINFDVRTDSIWSDGNFNLGGWQFLAKIDADELGIAVGTDENSISAYTSVYPNPTSGLISFSAVYHDTNVAVYNARGQAIYTDHLSDQKDHIDISHLPTGIYVLRLYNIDTKDVKSVKVVKVE